jgi:rSAM/selenodomain-associated transferase 1
MQERALIIFIKNKEKGKVKTRLAATVGNDEALNIYEQLLELTKDVTKKTSTTRYVYYSSHIEMIDEGETDYFNKKTQRGADLGARMNNAFEDILQQHKYAVIIGSDCAALTTQIIESAFESLTSHDLVIGPALDGGYYLLGMKKLHNKLFQDIVWSTETVLQDTLLQAQKTNLSVHQLQTLSDIDNEIDWNTYLDSKK